MAESLNLSAFRSADRKPGFYKWKNVGSTMTTKNLGARTPPCVQNRADRTPDGLEEIVHSSVSASITKDSYASPQANLRKLADVYIPPPPSFRAINWIRARTSRRIENASDGSRLDRENKAYREKIR
jgi:hypothetical protein